MDEKSESSSSSRWFWSLALFVLVVGIFVAIALPNRIGRGTSKMNYIVSNLRQLDAAKIQWAFEHGQGITNVAQAIQLTNQLTEQDLIPYIHRPDNQDSLIRSVADERYTINSMNKSPEARLIHVVEAWPKEAIIRLSDNTNTVFEVIFPDGTKTYY
jgi:hypothetical protein